MRLTSWVARTAFALAWWLAISACIAQAARPSAEDHARAPVPDWVEWLELPAVPDPAPGAARVQLLSDDQVSLLGKVPSRFYRRASWVATAAGIGHAGDFTVDYDPSHSRVRLHGVWVERGGERQDRLASARIETLRREAGLESGLLDGQLSLHLVLDDVRVGDIVDFAVSVDGGNPALAEHFRLHQRFETEVPVRLRQVRVLRPAGRAMDVRSTGAAWEHRRDADPLRVDERWRLHDPAPMRSEERVPPWHSTGPELEIADRSDWDAVVRWALPLYPPPEAAALQRIAAALDLPQRHADEATILRAIRFVQDEIRYTGLELGAHAYQPFAPEEVLRRRYGDCKDKALLLVSLLRHLGLEAHPALVDVDDRERVADRLPGPQVFDHVIVRFVHDGREHWIDATAELQRGDLARLAPPPFGRALLVAPGEVALRELPRRRESAPLVDISEILDLRGGEAEEQADYRITTIYRGASADRQRRRFAQSGAQAVGEAYVEAVAAYYPGVQQHALPLVQDDPVANEFTVQEHYRILRPWGERGDGEPGRQFDVWLSEVDRALARPKAVARRAPWDLGDETDLRQRIEVQLGSDWAPLRDRHRIRNAHFSYEGSADNDGTRFVMEGRVRSLARHVPAEAVTVLRRDLIQLSDDVSYALLLGGAGSGDAAVWAGLVDARLWGVFVAIAALWGFVAWAGATRGLGPATGFWFRPRAAVRAGIDAGRQRLALLLLAGGGLVSALVDERVLGAVADGNGGFALLLGAVSMFGALLFGVLYALLYAWLGRRFGGQGDSDAVLVAAGWAQVPLLACIPVLAVTLALYGPDVVTQGEGLMLAPMVLVGVLVLLPMGLWTVVAWFPALAESHRIPVARALLVTALPLLLLAAGVLAFALWR